MKEFKTRKKNRLQKYDYSGDGWYFVTMCSKDKENIFGDCHAIVGADGCRPANVIKLNECGLIVDDELHKSEIIRDERSLIDIRTYIQDNPLNWGHDENNINTNI